MKPTWIVQPNIGRRRLPEELCSALDAQGIPYVEADVIPFDDHYTLSDDIEGDRIIPYGSSSLIRLMLEQHADYKGLFFDAERLMPSAWIKSRSDYVNKDALVAPLHSLYNIISLEFGDSRWFCRPDGDLKQFSGMTASASELTEWIEKVARGGFDIDANFVALLGRIKPIVYEWRYFVVNGEVIDGSLYVSKGRIFRQHVEDADLMRTAQTFADRWLPLTCVCMDLCETADGEMHLMEFNGINQTGFYDHDVGKVVESLTRYVSKLP